MVLKTTRVEREVFFVNGRRIGRLVARDGKPLSPAEDQASVQKGSSMEFEAAPVGHGLWMQTSSPLHLEARFVVKKLCQDVHITAFDFKKFNTGVLQQTTVPSNR